MTRRILRWSAVLLGVSLVIVAGSYMLDMRRAYGRIQGTSTVIFSPWGKIEFTQGGSGLPVVVIHGGGGGFDQGELVVQAVLGDGFRWIAPSRFGYLGSSMPEGATWDAQADAFAFLLDHLGIEQAAVVALSQGGPSALLLALRHPERVTSVTCLSCGVAPSTSADQEDANSKGNMLRKVFAHDYTYWPIAKFFKGQLMGMIGASHAVVAELTTEQHSIVVRLIDYMNPAAPRSAGVVLDNEATLPGGRIAAITAPTLIVHAQDDLLQLHHNAEFAAATMPNARLMSFERGGHVVAIVERDAIGAAIAEHIRSNAARASVVRR
jgi:2-hydroxy-6-oxonona-2,4-dienedioate hydrolase